MILRATVNGSKTINEGAILLLSVQAPTDAKNESAGFNVEQNWHCSYY